MTALGNALDPLLDALGDVTDSQYLHHPHCSEVVRAAKAAHTALNPNRWWHSCSQRKAGNSARRIIASASRASLSTLDA